MAHISIRLRSHLPFLQTTVDRDSSTLLPLAWIRHLESSGRFLPTLSRIKLFIRLLIIRLLPSCRTELQLHPPSICRHPCLLVFHPCLPRHHRMEFSRCSWMEVKVLLILNSTSQPSSPQHQMQFNLSW